MRDPNAVAVRLTGPTARVRSHEMLVPRSADDAQLSSPLGRGSYRALVSG